MTLKIKPKEPEPEPAPKSTLKILNICIRDNAGAAYSLSHALNKIPGISSINLRTTNTYMNYPTMAEARNYGKDQSKKIVEEADVIIFHSIMRPIVEAFGIDRELLRKKKVFLYFHGSDCRNKGKEIIEDSQKLLESQDLGVFVSTPDLLEHIPKDSPVNWLPVARDFQALEATYCVPKMDKLAIDSWAPLAKKVVLGHAPTNPQIKGTPLFNRVISEVVDLCENAVYLGIEGVTWDECLRKLSTVDILFDQYLIGSYGMIAVEAAAFGATVFCKLRPVSWLLWQKNLGCPVRLFNGLMKKNSKLKFTA